MIAGYGVASFEAVRLIQSLALDSTLSLLTSPYLPPCTIGLWLYRWGFSLLWTVAFFAATEGNTARFLVSDGARFTASLFGVTAATPAATSVVSPGLSRTHANDADEDADDLDALLLSDDDDILVA